jgi:hypothetical protein
MTPRRLLSAKEVGERLGLTAGGVSSRRRRGDLPEPDYQIGRGGPGTVYAWEPATADSFRPTPADDPAALPADITTAPDDMLIGPRQWAALEGAAPTTVRDHMSRARRRRREGAARPWDIPEPLPGNRWTLGAYRAYCEAQETLRTEHPGVWANARRRGIR